MLVFPQLSTGASAQYPLAKLIAQRAVQSIMEDGTAISLSDSAAFYVRWKLTFQDLSDQEAQTLTSFFAATQGSVQPFLFLDPAANHLLWSEDFSQSAWQTTGLSFGGASAGPLSGAAATRVQNQTTATLKLAQQTQLPGSIQTCFSIYLRADSPVNVTLGLTAGSQSQASSAVTTGAWQRLHVSGVFPGPDLLLLSVSIPAGACMDIFGPQLDAQPLPSTYVTSMGWNGVCPNARFDMTQFDRVATGPNRNTCIAFVRSNVPGGE